jgi:hypothetical protein
VSFLIDVADEGDLIFTMQGGTMRAWLVMKGKFVEITIESAYKMKQNDNDVSYAQPLATKTHMLNHPPGARGTTD